MDLKQKRRLREERILLSLKKFDFLTRSQIQRLHDLKGDRNAQRVLRQMEDYLNVTRGEQNIYYLNAKGREFVDCNKERKKSLNVNHYLMRNELYINLGCPKSWKNEMRITSSKDKGEIKIVVGASNKPKDEIRVVSDALFEADGRYCVVEVDHLQKMKNNKVKIEKYRRLIERNTFRGMPKLIWITVSEHRRRQLLGLCDGLDVEVVLMNDFY